MKKEGKKGHMKNRFTLVELLVVCAIMGILVSILMPSLEKAREATRRAVCLSNNGQVSVGLAKYANDNNYSLPKAKAGIRGGLGIDASTMVIHSESLYLWD